MPPSATKPRLADLSPEARQRALAAIPDDCLLDAYYDWEGSWARPAQREPEGDWRYWLLRSGRGAGKTRVGAEWVRRKVEAGIYGRIALIAPTAADARDVMVEGESGILATSRPDFRPEYLPSKRRIEWPNGAKAFVYSAEEPDRLRGPQHDAAWCDELAAWPHPETWSNLLFGLRLGKNPRAVVTTTPRPTKLVRQIAKDPHTVVTTESTFDNVAHLAQQFVEEIVAQYEGTRLGRQELHGELLEDVEGALWSYVLLDAGRVATGPLDAAGKEMPWSRVTVNVDPAGTSGEESDETGIVVTALGADGHGYTLDDRSGRYTPEGWARKALELYYEYEADTTIAEQNYGGDMVSNTIRMIDANVPVRVVNATRGKVLRAEPVSMLYHQGRWHHRGSFPKLEDQMCSFTVDYDRRRDGSPDRVDALVWGATHLLVKRRGWTHEQMESFARGDDLRGPEWGDEPATPEPTASPEDEQAAYLAEVKANDAARLRALIGRG